MTATRPDHAGRAIAALKGGPIGLVTSNWPSPAASVLLLLTFALFGAIPLLQAGLYASHDGPLHVYRLEALDAAIRDGQLYPRWASDLMFGYGSPLFNFLPMLPYYVAETFHVAGLGFIDATKATAFLSLLTAPLAAWFYARPLVSAPAALGVGLAYAFVPYRFVDLYTRANFPEFIAFTWFPLLLWSFRKLAWDCNMRWFPVASLVLAALLLTHTPSAMLFLVVLAGHLALWLGLQLSAIRDQEGRSIERPYVASNAFGSLVAAALGALLAAGYLLPAFLEQAEVWRERIKIGEFFWLHFPEDGLLGLLSFDAVQRYGLGLVEPEVFQYQIGLAQWVLAALGTTALVARWRGWGALLRLEGTLAVVVAIAAALMCLSLSEPLWRALPVMQTVQFPWRLLMLVALPSALLAGIAVEALTPRVRVLAPVALGALLLASTTPGLRLPLTHFEEGQVTPAGFQVVESTFAVLATTSNAEWTPRTVGIDPWADLLASPWALAHLAGKMGDPVSHTIRDGVRAEVLSWRTAERLLRVEAERGGPVAFNVFYFPGWRAWTNGVETPVRPSDPEGLVTIYVPAGSHSVLLRMDRTPLQRTAEALSLIGLAVIAFCLWRWCPRGAWAWVWPRIGLASVAVVIVALVGWVWLWRNYRDQVTFEGPYQVAHRLDFGTAIIEGYRLEGVPTHRSGYPIAKPGNELGLTVFWQNQATNVGGEPQFYLRLATNRKEWGIVPLEPQGSDEPSRLRRSSALFRVPHGLPPGTYQLEIGTLGEAEPWMVGYTHQHLFHGLSEAVITSLVVAETSLSSESDLPLQANLPVSNDLTLVAYDISRRPDHSRQLPGASNSISAGDRLRLTLLWKVEGDNLPDLTMVARLVNAEGDQYAATHEAPAGGLYSSRFWSSGQAIRDVMNLAIPAHTPTGRYRLTLEVRRPEGPVAAPTLLGEVDLQAAPAPLLFPPTEPTIPLAAGIELVQAEHAPSIGPGERLHVMLHWWARAQIGSELLARVDLVDAADRVVASVAGPPAGANYPTSQWRSNERVRQWFRLPVPADTATGEHKLRLGLATLTGQELAKTNFGVVQVSGRSRRFDLPENVNPANVPFGTTLTLRGYRIGDSATVHGEPPSQVLPVLLAWQANEQSDRSLAVSVQMLDSAGRLVAQHDGIPQEGKAPVPGWVSGEIVEDQHFLRLPEGLRAGEYSLQVIVYDAQSGQRLEASDGRDGAILQILTIAP